MVYKRAEICPGREAMPGPASEFGRRHIIKPNTGRNARKTRALLSRRNRSGHDVPGAVRASYAFGVRIGTQDRT
jgi:hypothetical protein